MFDVFVELDATFLAALEVPADDFLGNGLETIFSEAICLPIVLLREAVFWEADLEDFARLGELFGSDVALDRGAELGCDFRRSRTIRARAEPTAEPVGRVRLATRGLARLGCPCR